MMARREATLNTQLLPLLSYTIVSQVGPAASFSLIEQFLFHHEVQWTRCVVLVDSGTV